ncbi:MAG: hypothetical protein WD824_02860 [Cyclobacteriaceae bacterium]
MVEKQMILAVNVKASQTEAFFFVSNLSRASTRYVFKEEENRKKKKKASSLEGVEAKQGGTE